MKGITKTILVVIIIILALFVVKEVMRINTKSVTGNLVLDSVNLEDPFLGPKDAELVVIEYSEFQCPYCSAAVGTHEQLVQRFKSSMPDWEASVPKLEELAREGKIKFIFKHFPLDFHEYAQIAAEASEAANAQGKFWEFHDELFKTAGNFDEDTLIEIAEDLELDVERFKAELDAGVYTESVTKDRLEGVQQGIRGTPAFLVNGKLISGAQPFSVFEKELGLE